MERLLKPKPSMSQRRMGKSRAVASRERWRPKRIISRCQSVNMARRKWRLEYGCLEEDGGVGVGEVGGVFGGVGGMVFM